MLDKKLLNETIALLDKLISLPSVSREETATADAVCMFLRSKLLQDRKIALKYKYEKDGLVYHATDTLTFRNRIRDGVNEWQDENQEHYK